jgi:hypothetical protein
LLLPFANPVWVQYMSHKVGRLIVPWALVTLFVASLAISPGQPFYAAALALQGVFYGLAISEAVFHAPERITRVAYTFVVMNLSAVAGLAALRRGREVWR